MKNESDRARFFVYRHMDINLLNGNVLRYKKESCSATSSFWVAQDARGRVWAFEVGERSEVGVLESLLYLMLKLACKHVDTKKTNYCVCNIFICVAQDARGRVGDYGEIPLSSRLLAND